MDRGAWQATVHGVEESDMTKHACTCICIYIYVYSHTHIYTHIYIFIYKSITEPLCCIAEINTTLYINYISIKINQWKSSLTQPLPSGSSQSWRAPRGLYVPWKISRCFTGTQWEIIYSATQTLRGPLLHPGRRKENGDLPFHLICREEGSRRTRGVDHDREASLWLDENR